ncbi:conserved hypothetical protein [Trichinella spiralis]|uniref:hypothetical protein n=1 Tax=Trichinella spiralis TaxID=6334 RepID=UPI0001EFD0F1|nr:conserved hypothetical protein [Trichinella spiralis]
MLVKNPVWENLSISTSPSQNLEDARESSSASNCAVGQSDPQLPTHHYHTRQQLQRLKREILNNEMPTKSCYGADDVDSNDGEVDLYQRTAFVPFKKCRGLLEPLQSGLRSNGSKTATMNNNTLSVKEPISRIFREIKKRHFGIGYCRCHATYSADKADHTATVEIGIGRIKATPQYGRNCWLFVHKWM